MGWKVRELGEGSPGVCHTFFGLSDLKSGLIKRRKTSPSSLSSREEDQSGAVMKVDSMEGEATKQKPEEEKTENSSEEKKDKAEKKNEAEDSIKEKEEENVKSGKEKDTEKVASLAAALPKETNVKVVAAADSSISFPSPRSSPDSQEVSAAMSSASVSLSSSSVSSSSAVTTATAPFEPPSSVSPYDLNSSSSLNSGDGGGGAHIAAMATGTEMAVDVESPDSPVLPKATTTTIGKGSRSTSNRAPAQTPPSRKRGGRRKTSASTAAKRKEAAGSCSSSSPNSDDEISHIRLPTFDLADIPANPKYIVNFSKKKIVLDGQLRRFLFIF